MLFALDHVYVLDLHQ